VNNFNFDFPDEPILVHVPLDDPIESIATLIRHFPPEATTILTDLTKERPLTRTELNVKLLMANIKLMD
jgi:hypothetical protein